MNRKPFCMPFTMNCMNYFQSLCLLSARYVIQINQLLSCQLFNHGAVSRVRVTVYYKFCTVHVLMRQRKSPSFENVAQIRELCHIMEEK